jgi:type IV secretion system protein VirB10
MTDPVTRPEPATGRPLVARPVRNHGVWLFAGAMAVAATALFLTLEARREAVVSPGVTPPADTGAGVIAAPPPLAVPQDDAFYMAEQRPTLRRLPGLSPYAPDGAIPRAPIMPGQFVRGGNDIPRAPRTVTPQFYPGPPIIQPPAAPVDPASNIAAPPAGSNGARRATATRFANPSLTVPQGAIVQAVLETALDSNRPGFARAIVSRDVRSFDGSRVLIQRGSRLFGEYQADVALGQNRIGIIWQKLTRPDGVQIELESPAADPLGQTGVKGRVNSHFFPRFGAAILQSALDIGVGLATRSATNGTVIVGLPGAVTSVQVPGQEPIKPTIKVRQGASVSVFVAKDLDFSTVEP